jgi:hypothetical protein
MHVLVVKQSFDVFWKLLFNKFLHVIQFMKASLAIDCCQMESISHQSQRIISPASGRGYP